LESALRLFDESYRVYQLLFKRNRQAIPHTFCGKAVVDSAIRDRVAYFTAKSDNLFSLSILPGGLVPRAFRPPVACQQPFRVRQESTGLDR